MTKRTVWKQVECIDKDGKAKLTGMVKIEITALFIPLSELNVNKMIYEKEKIIKNRNFL